MKMAKPWDWDDLFAVFFFGLNPIENEVIQEAMHALHLADAEVRFEHFFLVGVGWIFFSHPKWGVVA